jgi:peptidoglycan/LPS O-acetylase OafA/YrhL
MTQRPSPERKFDFIDAARGFAILLVVICHTSLPQEPWPVRRFTMLGWHGVQLFFVVSSLTLALSWRRRSALETWPILSFLVRRLFRIWPMYFVAFVGYLLVWPPGPQFSWAQMLASLSFVHGWSPGLLPTVDGAWNAVPGSWSVAVEFSFYLLFPILVWIASTPARAGLLIAASVTVAFACNAVGRGAYLDTYGTIATDQWLYYWLPNQLPVFGLGFLLCQFFIRLQPGGAWASARQRLLPLCPALALLAVALFLSLGVMHLPREPSLWPPALPIHLLASVAFALGVLAIGLSPIRLFVNHATVWLGKVSFSVYLIHFAVIDAVQGWLPGVCGDSVTGMRAILGSAILLVLVLGISFVLSMATYRAVEQPMIARGRVVCDWMNRTRVPARTPQPSA